MKPWLLEIDGLRAVAALSVVLTHYHLNIPEAHLSFLWPPAGFPFACVGVILFFVISSFLLALLMTREYYETNRINLVSFFIRRILRIWPLYFFIIGIAYLELAPWGLLSFWPFSPIPSETWLRLMNRLWTYFCFISNWDLAFYKFNGLFDAIPHEFTILWSIAIEEQFYLFFPFMMILWFKFTHLRVWIPTTLICIAILTRYLFVHYPVQLAPPGMGGMYYCTLTYLDVFVYGAMAGMMFYRDKTKTGILHKMLHLPGFGLILATILLVLSWVWRNDVLYPYSVLCIIAYHLFGFILAIGILWILAHPSAVISRLLRSSILRFLGSISYGIYVWHLIVLRIINQLFMHGIQEGLYQHIGLMKYFPLICFLFLTILLASITYFLVEKPFMNLKNFFNDRIRSRGKAYLC